LPYPDVLIYNGQLLSMVIVEIYMVFLVNIVDSQMNLKNVRDVYDRVRAAIKWICRIVKVFGDDHASFWSFLQHVGCVTDSTPRAAPSPARPASTGAAIPCMARG